MVKINVDDDLVNADWPKALEDQIAADKRLIKGDTKTVKKGLGDDFAFAHLFKGQPDSGDLSTAAPIGVMGPNGGLKRKKDKKKRKRLVGFKFSHLTQPVVVEDLTKARDGDGDGFVYDGTPKQRPATPAEKAPKKRTLKKPDSRTESKRFGVSEGRELNGFRPATQDDVDRVEKIIGKKIPPAWTDVQVPDDPESSDYHLKGYDAAGRVQPVQTQEAIDRNAAAKFERVRELSRHIPLLDEELETEALLGPTEGALALIRYGGLRPGSDKDTGAEKKAYGATNMLTRHATVSEDGKSVHIKMTGKKGVALDLTIEHPTAVAAVKAHAEGKDPDEPLFGTTPARALKVLKGIVGDEFQVKDLRTYVATSLAYDLVRKQDPPTSQKDFAKKRRAIGKQVSDVLGNNPTMALNSYISPLVFAGWQNAWETE